MRVSSLQLLLGEETDLGSETKLGCERHGEKREFFVSLTQYQGETFCFHSVRTVGRTIWKSRLTSVSERNKAPREQTPDGQEI